LALFKALTKLTRWLWLFIATVVIGTAILVVLVRQLLPLLDNYRSDISESLSEITGLNINVGRLSGTWNELSPTISLGEVVVKPPVGERSSVEIGQLNAQISPLGSFLSKEIIWQELNIDKVVVTATENADGEWSIAGIPLQSADNPSQQAFKPLKMLFYSTFINIDEVVIQFEFYSGTEWSIGIQDILIENSEDFHRVLARLITERGDEAARLVVEARGDYLVDDDFKASGYVRLQEVGFGPEFSTFARDMFPKQVEMIGDVKATIDAEVWFDMVATGEILLTGQLTSNEIPLRWLNQESSINNLQSDITGWFTPGKDWGLRFQGLDFDWLDQKIDPLNVQLVQQVGKNWNEFSVLFNHINLDTAQELLLKTGLLKGAGKGVIETISPKGRISQFDINFSNKAGESKFKMTGNLDGVSLRPWKGAPGVNNLDGYIEATAEKGFVIFDSNDIDFFYKSVYDKPIKHDLFQGQVNWQWHKNTSSVSVVSGDMNLGERMGDMSAHLYLDIPIVQKNKKTSMFLQIVKSFTAE